MILQVIEEGPEPRPRLEGKKRVYRVWLDTNQYQSDMGRLVEGAEDVYETFNVFVRRKPKENNFKVHALKIHSSYYASVRMRKRGIR